MEPRVGNKFRLGRKIGSGSFGEIYLGACRSSFSMGDFGPCYVFADDIYLTSLSLSLVDAGTNIQTNEEVAIKLVRARISVAF
jgi:serine/threonine protein kinase